MIAIGCQPPPRVDSAAGAAAEDSAPADASGQPPTAASSPSPPADDPSPPQTSTDPAKAAPSDGAAPAASNKEPPLIPRHVLFGNPQRATARISPNGKWLSYLAPVGGILNVFVAPVDDVSQAKQVTDDKTRDIRGYSWAYTGEHILYTQDKAGDENWHVYAADVASNKTTDLTPLEKVHATIEGVSEKFPDEILVGLNDRNPQLHDIYRVNIKTGERTLIQENPGFAALIT
ncbi:MAG: S9 family peptidase, partial [Planctomycetota bacterium]